MNKFPNKKIAAAYESAKGKLFHKRTTDMSYIDLDGKTDYDHVALNWLEANGILGRELRTEGAWVFEYRLVK